MATASIAVSVKARTSQFLRGLKRARRSLKRFARSVGSAAATVKRVGIGIAAFGVGAAFAFHRITRAGELFNQKMNRSLAIMSGVSESVRRTMKRTAIEVARTTIHSAEQAAESYFFLASAGLSVKQSIAALPTVARFAQAGMFDMARATDLLTDAQSALGMTVKDVAQNMTNMKHVADVLVKANTLANASVEQFSESLTTKAAAALKMLNKSIEEGVAVLAAYADQGVKGSEAGTALQIVIRELTSKAIINKAAFAKYNIEVFDSDKKMRNLALIISDVEQALAGMADETQKTALMQLGFTNKSISFMQTLLGMSGRINEYESALSLAGGTMERVANKQLTAMEKAVAALKASWVSLSDTLKPAVEAVAEVIKIMSESMLDFEHLLAPNQIAIWAEESMNAIARLATFFDRKMKFMAAVFVGEIADMLKVVREARNLFEGMFVVTAGSPQAKMEPGKKHLTRKPSALDGLIARFEEAYEVGALRTMRAEEAVGNIGTTARLRIERAARKREMDVAKERWRGLWEDIVVGIKKAYFEAQRKPAGPGDVAGEPEPAADRGFGQFRRISPSRFHIPGMAAATREQTVKDVRAHGLLQKIVEHTRDSTARFT